MASPKPDTPSGFLRSGKAIWIAVAVVAALAALFVWRSAHSGEAGGAPKVINIASIAAPYQGKQVYNGLTGVIIQQGWLKDALDKRGIQLNFVPVPTAVGAPLINEGFSGKRIDFASYGDFPAVIAAAGGVPLKLVAPLGGGQNVYLVVRKDSPAKTLADLKGKKIALHRGRPWELPFSKLVDASGLKISDFTIVNINPSATPAALAAGSVDATVLLSDGLLLEQKGVGKVIWSTAQAPADWKMRAELFARGDFVDANPELTQLVVDAYVRAAAWSSKDENRTQVIKNSSRGYLPEDILAKDYAADGLAWHERFSPVFHPDVKEHYRAVADYAFKRGLIRRPVDTDKLLDDRFVTKALQSQNLQAYWSTAPDRPRTANALAVNR
ncbi:ABC transporter substrate-binding protein [Novosphingobium sp. G106]|uniref:ABC transporter substrate-binding protein n=1 Tax=Novosphingobium sp. G106 TaxID=2849500 RepID=UPI0028115274|nr:ABC transporter substrate-binding protein [Novosphingobium sp. G106]